jgi:hypothetical protein
LGTVGSVQHLSWRHLDVRTKVPGQKSFLSIRSISTCAEWFEAFGSMTEPASIVVVGGLRSDVDADH